MGESLGGAPGEAWVRRMVSEPFGTFPVCAPSLPGCQPATLASARDGAVDMPSVITTVDQKRDVALLALADADFQWTSTRSKNWTPSPPGHILCLPVVWCIRAAHEGSELRTPGLRLFYDPRCPPTSTRFPPTATFRPRGWYPVPGDPGENGTSSRRWRQPNRRSTISRPQSRTIPPPYCLSPRAHNK